MTEWDQRLLCPDGACIGVIGDDGTCKVCGRVAPNWGDERMRGLNPEPSEAEDDDDEDDEDEDGAEDTDDAYDEDDDDEDEDEDDEEGEDDQNVAPEDPRAPASIGEWSGRKLCPDGACVGLIGENGLCKVCGKSAV